MTAGTAPVARTPLRLRVPLGPNGPLGMFVDPMTWRALPYLLGSVFHGLVCFAVLVSVIPFSLTLAVAWVGAPLLALTMVAWRGAAMLERRLVGLAFGVRIPDPYRPGGGGNPLLRCGGALADPATWKDLLYLLLLPLVGLVEFVVSAALWAVALALLVTPPLVLSGVMEVRIVGELTVDGPAGALACVPAGLGVLVAALYATRGMARLHGQLAMALLGPGEKIAGSARLRASRARGADAAEAERRRIERDLHDGAQQRLLSVAMDLGRAQVKLDSDPETARRLLAQAHEGAKAAIAELRDLARGIHPAILTDRGLDAALSALAARAPVRAAVSVELAERPPAAVESVAYFVVAEALTNMAKHSGATEASVRVGLRDRRVSVEVRDNGSGGALARPGGGLAGLADRAATVDGVLGVDSPPGGPTVIRAELPCDW
ncbi:sensor domain-containing protein [Streptosporangium sp. NPDC000239]|uniref:sensor histidine kinase n=1 Tax=Streptosporangium sp. NPDC000239 TaxID=3154248 RepID=UPI003327B1BD